MTRRIVLCVLVGLSVGLVFHQARGFLPAHAFLVGLASSALTYSLLRTIDNLRGASRDGSPGHQEEAGDE